MIIFDKGQGQILELFKIEFDWINLWYLYLRFLTYTQDIRFYFWRGGWKYSLFFQNPVTECFYILSTLEGWMMGLSSVWFETQYLKNWNNRKHFALSSNGFLNPPSSVFVLIHLIPTNPDQANLCCLSAFQPWLLDHIRNFQFWSERVHLGQHLLTFLTHF